MEKTLNYFMGRIPKEIGMEIFQFLIPDKTNLVMREYAKFEYLDEYNPRYKLMYESSIPKRVFNGNGTPLFSTEGEKQIVNDMGIMGIDMCVYLSVIPKKNGKNRYYLTRDIENTYCRVCCGINGCISSGCPEYYEEDADSLKQYRSIYVGTDIEKALYDLFVFEVIPW